MILQVFIVNSEKCGDLNTSFFLFLGLGQLPGKSSPRYSK